MFARPGKSRCRNILAPPDMSLTSPRDPHWPLEPLWAPIPRLAHPPSRGRRIPHASRVRTGNPACRHAALPAGARPERPSRAAYLSSCLWLTHHGPAAHGYDATDAFTDSSPFVIAPHGDPYLRSLRTACSLAGSSSDPNRPWQPSKECSNDGFRPRCLAIARKRGSGDLESPIDNASRSRRHSCRPLGIPTAGGSRRN